MNAHVSGNGRLEDYSEEDDCRQCVINGDADAEEESFYECIQEWYGPHLFRAQEQIQLIS